MKICEAVRSAVGAGAEPASAFDAAAVDLANGATARRPRARAVRPAREAAAPPPAPPVDPPPLQDSGTRPISRHTLERVLAEQLAGVKQEAKRPSHARRYAVFAGVALCLLLVAGAAAWLYLGRGRAKPRPPLTTVAVDDEFINVEKWTVPPTGWRIDTSSGAGSLEVTNQPQVGYLSEVALADFEASFSLKLLDNRGAAWALRVNGEGDYYLFYLSGPEGLYPNRFLSYVVRDGKPDPKSERSTNVVAELKEGQFYEVVIKAEGNKFTHTMTPEATGVEVRLGDFVDPNNTHPWGSIGFRTMGGEKFSVDDLFIYPPGTKKP